MTTHTYIHKCEQCASRLAIVSLVYMLYMTSTKNNYVVEFLYIADYTLLTFNAIVLKEIHFIGESLF